MDGVKKFQFKLRTIMIVTAGIAAILAIFPKTSLLVLGNGILGLAVANAGWCWIVLRHARWRIISLFACMYFPFAWMVRFDDPAVISGELFWMISGLPAMIPTLFVGGFVYQNLTELTGLTFLLTGIELIIGLWLIRCGPKWAIASNLAAISMSIYGSFGVHALLRM